MSAKNLRFEQKKNFVENGYSISFNIGLTYPVNIHAADSREEVMTQYLRAHAPTMEVQDSAGNNHELIVRKDVAYVRTGGGHYSINNDPMIDVMLDDGNTHKIDTRLATVNLENGISKLPPCRDARAVKEVALKLLDDPVHAELRKGLWKSSEGEEKYTSYVASVCKEHGIENVREKDGVELPVHEQNRDLAYVIRAVNQVPGLERSVQKIKDSYAKENIERGNVPEERPDIQMEERVKQALAGLDSVKLKDTGNAHLMGNTSPVFAHLENHNLPALS